MVGHVGVAFHIPRRWLITLNGFWLTFGEAGVGARVRLYARLN